MTFTCKYEFEELRLLDRQGNVEFSDGILLFGEAELESDGEAGSFYIKNIQLGDVWLDRSRTTFQGQMFLRICEALYADEAVARHYCDAEEEAVGRPFYPALVYSTLNHAAQGTSSPAVFRDRPGFDAKTGVPA